MSRKIRKVLFYGLMALFLILGPGIILYANGWRVDFKNWKPVKVGGIFLENYENDMSVFINNKQVFGSLLSNLLPAGYDVKIEKNGYYTWRKNLIVNPTIVTEEKIILVPSKIESQLAIGEKITDFWNNGKIILYRDAGGRYFLTDLNNATSRINFSSFFVNLKEKRLGLPGYVPIEDIIPQEDPNRWGVKTKNGQYLVDVKNAGIVLAGELPESISKPYPLNLDEALKTAKKYSYDSDSNIGYFLDRKGIHSFAL
ncbi:MAG: hypothetical protein AAB646_02725 [Patescibacteria group bacterium]